MKNRERPEIFENVTQDNSIKKLNSLGKSKIVNYIILNYKYLLIIILLIVSIIFNLMLALFFNQKLNKINSNVKNWINVDNISKSAISNDNKEKYEFSELLEVSENYDPTKQYFYYPNNNKNTFSNAIKDEDGVRLVEVRGEIVYNPVSIAQYGLIQYSNYIENNNEEYLNDALVQAEYLLKIQDKENGKFYYDFNFKVGGTNCTLEAPWSSAMAQGQIISLFCRIYNQTSDEKYLDAAKLALKPLTIKVEDGGLVADFFGRPYLEEYPTEPANYTLNGYMFTIIGVYDLYHVSSDETAKQIYDTAIETLEYCLPFYDYEGISLYHLGYIKDTSLEKFYIPRYHTIHIAQLETLNQIEQNEIFEYYINKWTNYVLK